MIFVLWSAPIEPREGYKTRNLIGLRVFERSGGKKRTRWQSGEDGFPLKKFPFEFCLRISSSWTFLFMTQSIMSVAALVGSFDDIVRSTTVLAEGIEGGLLRPSFVIFHCL